MMKLGRQSNEKKEASRHAKPEPVEVPGMNGTVEVQRPEHPLLRRTYRFSSSVRWRPPSIRSHSRGTVLFLKNWSLAGGNSCRRAVQMGLNSALSSDVTGS